MLETAQVLAQGYNVFETEKRPSGVVKYLASPQDVIGLIQSGKLKQHILLVRGGTTTFLAPALSMGAIGVITMSGAPESHLGILSREFQIPCVMTVHLPDSNSRYVPGETGDEPLRGHPPRLEGKNVTLACRDHDTGKVVLTSTAAAATARNGGARVDEFGRIPVAVMERSVRPSYQAVRARRRRSALSRIWSTPATSSAWSRWSTASRATSRCAPAPGAACSRRSATPRS